MQLPIFYSIGCQEYLGAISRAVSETYGIKIAGTKELYLTEKAYDASRKQYDSAMLLNYLLKKKGSEPALWVIGEDMYTDGLNFVFGQAVPWQAAVLSLHRLVGCRLPEEIISKEAVHEVGHILGLAHCKNSCVMQFSNSLKEAEMKPWGLCESCKKKLRLA